MKLKKIFALLLTITAFVSCNDLEEELFSTYSATNFYQNEEQLQAQNIGIYQAFRHVVWEQDMYFLASMPNKYATTRAGAGFFNNAIYATNELQPFRYERIWNVAYQAIARANTVIKNVPTSSFYASNPDVGDQYIAEAKWMRAYTYFQLTQLFGELPIYTEPTESADPEILYKGRESVQEVYDLIIEDLIFAKDNLPLKWNTTGRGRAVKSSGSFLLGKVYLTSAGLPLQNTANYQKAIDVLKPLADSPEEYDVALLPEWKDVFSIDNEGNKEIIFGHGNIYEIMSGGVLPFWTNPLRSTLGGTANGNAGSSYLLAWHPDLLSIFEDEDVRKSDGFTYTYVDKNGNTINYNPSLAGATPPAAYKGRNGISSTKYIDPGAPNNVAHSKDHIVYRYADVFLMLAEAYNENGETSNALQYLNISRNRVGASDIITIDQTELQEIIREERTREFYGEMMELFDLRRWGTAEQEFDEHRLRLWRAPNKPWENKFLLCPIPDVELATNPNLSQNPGW